MPTLVPGSLICVAATASLGVLDELIERARRQQLEWTPLSTWLDTEAN